MSVRSVSRGTAIRFSKGFSKILAVSFLAGGFFAGNVKAVDDSPADAVSQVVQGVFNHSHDAVVKIEGLDPDHNVSIGTGFFIDPSGMIYTSYSVGGDTDAIVVSYGEKKYPAKRLLGDPRSGVAILKIDARTPFLPIYKGNELAIATPVVAIGYLKNLPLAPSLGIVAGIDSRNNEGLFLTKHIRVNIAAQPGQGGAPMLNLKGEVVGIVISGDSGSSCYALPIEAVEKVRLDYERFGDIHHGWIGIGVAQATKAINGSIVLVDELFENTPAAKSGLKKGDVLLQIGDKKITTPEDVLDASFFLTGGDEVPIIVLRGNAEQSPSSPGGGERSMPCIGYADECRGPSPGKA